jgi:hypothetical protein
MSNNLLRDGKDSLRDKDNGGRERSLQDTLDRAIRRASHQSGTKCKRNYER